MTGWLGWLSWTGVLLAAWGLLGLLTRIQPGPSPRVPEPRPSECSDPPCCPEDGWICGHHHLILVQPGITRAEEWANHG